MLIPLISIVFLALANKAIKKDEDLVKSVDRIDKPNILVVLVRKRPAFFNAGLFILDIL